MTQRLVRRAAAGGLVAAAVAAMAAATPAHATAPGANGKITYSTGSDTRIVDPNNPTNPIYFVGGSSGAWSPDGSRYAYTRTPYGGISTVRSDGSDQLTVTTDSGTQPTWTAGGQRIFYTLNNALSFVSSDGGWWTGNLNENPDTARYVDTHTSMSRTDIIFQRYDNSTSSYSVLKYNSPGSTTVLVANAAEPDLSPDGTKIAYRSTVDNQVYVANVDGSNPVKLTASSTGASNPRWSPDGTTILYVASTSMGTLWTIKSDGSAPATSLNISAVSAEWQPVRTNSVDRVWGQNAIGTGIAASQWNYADFGDTTDTVRSPAKAVVLSRSDAFYDALAGSALAVNKQAPLLITPPDALDSGVEGEIKRVLGTSGDVYLLGGTAALSSNVESRLQTLGYTTHRLAGANVFSTAIAVDNEMMQGATPSIAVVATGMDYYDALSAGAAAGANPGTVVLLTYGSSMPWETANYLNNLNPDPNTGTLMVAAGGPGENALIGGYQSNMMPSWPGQINYQPLVGDNAMDTALQVAQFFFAAPPMAAVSTFNGWYDALTGGAMSGLNYGPLLLTTPDGLYGPVRDYLSQNAGGMWDTVIMGGTAALPSSLQSPLGEAISVSGQWVYNDYPAIIGSSPMKPHALTLRPYGPKSTDVRSTVPGASSETLSTVTR